MGTDARDTEPEDKAARPGSPLIGGLRRAKARVRARTMARARTNTGPKADPVQIGRSVFYGLIY